METPVNKTYVTEDLRTTYPGAFTATDINVLLRMPEGPVRALGNLAAVSISTHRDSFFVTSLSSVGVKGFTQGHRTIAGTLIFHTIDRGAFNYKLNTNVTQSTIYKGEVLGLPHPDGLPLFDIYITYVNDVGMAAYESLIGVRILDFGKTISLENLHPMESYSYMALSYVPMQTLMEDPDYQKDAFILNRADPRKRPILHPNSGGNAADNIIDDPHTSEILDRLAAGFSLGARRYDTEDIDPAITLGSK